jgi:type I restriction enzyme S subunit
MNRIPLSQVCNYSDDSIQVSELNLNNFISTDNMLPNRGGITGAVNLPPANSCSAYSKGEILISNIRPYFKKIWFAEFDGGCSADVLVLKTTNPKFDPKFIYYNLFQDLFFKHQMTGSKGSKMPRGDKDQIMTFLIPAFDKSYQKRISEFLTVIDEKIALNKKINTELENLAKTIYNYWFVQFDFPNAEGKPYKTSGGEVEWNEELKREIPKGWEDGILNDLIEIHDSKRIPLSNHQREMRKGPYPYYGATEIMDYIDDFIFDGTFVLMAEDGSVMDKNGNPVLQYIWGKSWVNNHAHVLEGKRVSNEFLHLMLKNIPVIQIMSGSIQKKINQENLKNTPILFIPDNLLRKFDDIICPLYTKLKYIHEQNQELIKLRDFLLPLLMNGQVKVKSEAKEQLSMAAEPQVKYGK